MLTALIDSYLLTYFCLDRKVKTWE